MTDRNEEKTRKIVEGVEEAEKRERDILDSVTLSTGVELKLKPVPKHFIFQVTSKFKLPKVPTTFNKTKGRDEENPDDPDYQEAVEQYLIDIANATTDVCFLRGTEIAKIPKEIPKPNSQEWISEMEVLGMPMIDNKRARYLAWIKGIAAPSDADITILMEEIGRQTGVSEADTEEAVKRFQRLTSRGTD